MESLFCFLGLMLFGARIFDSCSLDLYICNAIVGKTMASWATNIYILDHNARICFGLYINNFVYHLFKANGFLILLFYLNFNGKLEAFSEIANYSRFIRDFDRIKFRKKRLEMLKVECSVLGFFLANT